jgi:hypothetical protein
VSAVLCLRRLAGSRMAAGDRTNGRTATQSSGTSADTGQSREPVVNQGAVSPRAVDSLDVAFSQLPTSRAVPWFASRASTAQVLRAWPLTDLFVRAG